MDLMGPVKIRALAYGDLDAIVEIDKAILGKERPEYWSIKIEISVNRSPLTSLVAEMNGNVFGFIMGMPVAGNTAFPLPWSGLIPSASIQNIRQKGSRGFCSKR